MKKLWNSRMVRVFLARKSSIVCLIILIVFILMSIFAPLITTYDPNKNDLKSLWEGVSAEHWLGTDGLGRDILTRIIYGGRISFIVGFVSVFIAGTLGMIIGLIAGMKGGIIESILMRIMDAMSSIPVIILALFLSSILGKGLLNICLAIGISMIPSYARLTRGQVISTKNTDYVVAGELSGASKVVNTLKHVFPNCIPYIIITMTTSLGAAILIESSLSYLGQGINPPDPTWGSMVFGGYAKLAPNPVVAIAPGVCIMIVVLCFSAVGDTVRDALDPKLRGTMGTSMKKRRFFKNNAKATDGNKN